MGARKVRIVYGCQDTPGLGMRPEYHAWMDEVRQVFGELGWNVDSQGPTMSATNVDEDELCLSSDGGPLPRSDLEAALRRVGIDPLYWSGDVDESA